MKWKAIASGAVFAASAVFSTAAEIIRYNAIKHEVKEQLPKEVARQLKKLNK